MKRQANGRRGRAMAKLAAAARRALMAAAVFSLPATVSAGPVYLQLVIDPATTAGAGIPSSGGFSVTSTRSGAGS